MRVDIMSITSGLVGELVAEVVVEVIVKAIVEVEEKEGYGVTLLLTGS